MVSNEAPCLGCRSVSSGTACCATLCYAKLLYGMLRYVMQRRCAMPPLGFHSGSRLSGARAPRLSPRPSRRLTWELTLGPLLLRYTLRYGTPCSGVLRHVLLCYCAGLRLAPPTDRLRFLLRFELPPHSRNPCPFALTGVVAPKKARPRAVALV